MVSFRILVSAELSRCQDPKIIWTAGVLNLSLFPVSLEHTDFAIKKLSFTLFFIARWVIATGRKIRNCVKLVWLPLWLMCNHCTFASTLFIYRYFIDWKSDGDSYFTIDGTEGTIATNELLDRESTAQYNFSIIASKVSKYGMVWINVILHFCGFNTLKRVPAEVFFIFRLSAEWSPGEIQKPVPFPHSISPEKLWQLPLSPVCRTAWISSSTFRGMTSSLSTLYPQKSTIVPTFLPHWIPVYIIGSFID